MLLLRAAAEERGIHLAAATCQPIRPRARLGSASLCHYNSRGATAACQKPATGSTKTQLRRKPAIQYHSI